MSVIELVLDGVAAELDWLAPPPVFVGGSTIGLFLDAFGRSHVRPTEDVDCIVPSVLSAGAWWKLEEELRRRRWAPDPAGPICRYRSPGGIRVDLMSEHPDVLGFAGRWYPLAVALSEQRVLVTGRSIHVPTASLLFACKLEAWHDRGRTDPLASKDLEDLVALLDGCPELETDIAQAPPDARHWIAASTRDLLDNHREATIAQLPPGGDRGGRERKVLARMSRIATTR